MIKADVDNLQKSYGRNDCRSRKKSSIKQKIFLLKQNKLFGQFEIQLKKIENNLDIVARDIKSCKKRLKTLEAQYLTNGMAPINIYLPNSDDIPSDAESYESCSSDAEDLYVYKKPVPIAETEWKQVSKLNLVFHVHPYEEETDLRRVEQEIRKIEMPGMAWRHAQLVPLVYGLQSLEINCALEGYDTSVEELKWAIEDINTYVQSVHITSATYI